MSAAVAERSANPIVVLKEQLDSREAQFKAALPAHIPVERFMRVVLTAVQNNADLVQADRQSFFNSCMRSAQDGLLPDGREGAIVIFNAKEKRDGRDAWIKKAQWMPMVFGILKKIRNSGEIATITARVVYGGDTFRYWIDDSGEHVTYEPADDPDTNTVRRVFAMAKTKGGELFVEPLTAADIEKIRNVSRAKDKGPWVDWWEEMAKKSAIRRLAKRLPMSTDMDDLLRRDDELYDMAGAREASRGETRRPRLVEALDQIAGKPVDRKPGTAEAEAATETPEAAFAETGQPDAGGEAAAELLDRLRGRAMEGAGALRLALRKLTEEEGALLTDDDRAQLEAAAKAADGGTIAAG